MYKTYIMQAIRLVRRDGAFFFLRRLAEILLTIPRIGGVPLLYKLRAWRNWKRSGKFIAQADPFKIVEIPPQVIEFYSAERFSWSKDPITAAGLVAAGQWDLSDVQFDDHLICRSLVAHIQEGLPWEHTPLIREARRLNEMGLTPIDRYAGDEEIRQRVEFLDRMIESIRHDGYRRNASQNSGELPFYLRFQVEMDEITANIGRDGRFLFCGSHHRLGVAKALRLPLVPVRILVRHVEWQQLRDDIAGGKRMWFDHPDLEDLGFDRDVSQSL